ncbi:hypothetical protein [Alkalimonas amylolytica]|uniref:Lipoprotein n=1 Tax=Alkalimonas amylolytica TaxID=152573 RepID=A0A1H4BR00_ALKAM|nr:hypothetical protein [Alkalimonas amylolytica]SEA50523.1 hypothetical protein SAMN04488051_103479 [Alkalimonas amylolytica]
MKTLFFILILSLSGCSIVHYTAEADLPDTEARAAVLHYRQGDSVLHIIRCGAPPLLLVAGLQGQEPLQSQDYRDSAGASCLLLQRAGQPVLLNELSADQNYDLVVQCQLAQLPAANSYTFSPLERKRQWLWPGNAAPWTPSPCVDKD